MNLTTNEKILTFIISHNPSTKAEFDELRRQICSQLKTEQPPNRDLIIAYQKLVKNKSTQANKIIEYFLRKAQIRTLSGIAVVTSLTKPFPCPGKCIYCPDEARMPKSYLASEPAAARALGLKFDPYEQMRRRILMLEANGHPVNKIEYIIKGGTWNTYPLKYQYWFILRSFQAANEAKKTKDQKIRRSKNKTDLSILRSSDLSTNIKNLQKQLQLEQHKNETSNHRIIGLTLETRPDFITPETIFHMRQMGCTRIELGLQAPDDKILKLIKRGHTVQQFKDALLLLRLAGFKVDLHFMPDLPGSTAKHDLEMYKSIFSDPGLKPDMIKIYPCTVIKNTELYKIMKAGKYKSYGAKKLLETIIQMKLTTPRYCRISRLIRDIPENEIEHGNIITNLREEIKKVMNERGLKCQCLRCREIGHQQSLQLTAGNLQLFTDKYETEGGMEYFLSYEDKQRQVVFAFLRLRLPILRGSPPFLGEELEVGCGRLLSLLPKIHDSAFIRELHTYGQLVPINSELRTKNSELIQHTGLGKKLVAEAEKIAQKNGFKKLAVISGVGVRGYYRKLGYKKTGTYMVKKLS